MNIPANWTFKDDNVAHEFDAHVREQLPWYDIVTRMVAHFGRCYIPTDGLIYDIGASTGNIGRSLNDTLENRGARLLAIESSAEMARLYTGPGELIVDDACSVDYQPFDFATLFLVLQFIDVSKRKTLLSKLRANLRPGGAILIVDKVPLPLLDSYLSRSIERLTLAEKMSAGATPDDILAKELSLIGIQRPLHMGEIGVATEVFRFGEFAGFIIEGAK